MYTYIIVDDEELIRKGTIKKISHLDKPVSCIGEASDGVQAIELIARLLPDFVILDMQMPQMGGMTLLPYLCEHYPSMPLIVISGYRDFDYIKQAISANAVEYLLKPFSREMIQKSILQVIDRLEKQLSIENQIQASEKEKEQAYYDYDIQLLHNLILGYHTARAELSSQKLNFINNTHSLMLLTLHSSTPLPAAVLQDWIEDQGFGNLALYIPGTDTVSLGFIILFLPQHGALPERHLADQILNTLLPWMAEQQIPIITGISRTHGSLSELNTAYRETSLALDGQKLMDSVSDRYFYSGEAEPRQIAWEHTEEFLFRIEAGMENQVRTLTGQLFSHYTEIPGCTLADVKYHCYHLSGQCRHILNEYLNTPNSPENSNSMQNVVNHLFTLEELEKYYLQFFLNLASMIRPQSVYAIDDTIKKIEIYMERNLQKNLTQEFISSLFFINRSYLSTLFKEKTGLKFVDYLNRLRIEKSKELLAQSDRKMYQVAKAVGYDNVKYFFRIFKKYEKMTPDQYRQKAHSGDSIE